jgi:hypothetical protein
VADEILPLSRWRATLARARAQKGGKGFAEALIADPEAPRWVPELPPQELYYAIREIGIDDAQELLALASPEQVRSFLDLAAWEREQLVPERAAEWIDALVDLGPERLAQIVQTLDPEVMALLVQQQARIYDLTMEQPPEEPEGHFYPTPDRFFLLDILVAGEAGKRIERLLDWLYRADLELARRVVMSAKWELTSELEEFAYRWRSGRMADLGFVEFYDALEVYRYLDPASVKIGEGSADRSDESAAPLPVSLAQAGGGGFLQKALAAIGDPDELARIHQALLVLANRVMAADGVEPGDPEGAREALARVAAYLGLGLELVGRGDPVFAGEALRTISLMRLFRVGVSITLKLKQAAQTLVEQAWVSLVPRGTSLLDPPYPAAIAELRAKRPRFLASSGPRLFASLAEVAESAAMLEEAALLSRVVQAGLGVDPQRLSEQALAGCHPPRPAITFSTIAATLAANALLDRPPALVPLAPSDLAPLRSRFLDGNQVRERLRAMFQERLHEREIPAPPAFPASVERWIDTLQNALAPSAIGAPGFDPHSLQGLIVRISSAA